MTIQPFNHDLDQSDFPKVTIWGIILLMLGGPCLPVIQQRSLEVARPARFNRYAVVIVLAGVLASTLELTIL
ncbi:MAG: hypothetical protein F6K00_24630 [Leptolyngbya sp. SIOISBB]|nr:hypothetical protein [Leptolyngbya sp. SIOISBB]